MGHCASPRALCHIRLDLRDILPHNRDMRIFWLNGGLLLYPTTAEEHAALLRLQPAVEALASLGPSRSAPGEPAILVRKDENPVRAVDEALQAS